MRPIFVALTALAAAVALGACADQTPPPPPAPADAGVTAVPSSPTLPSPTPAAVVEVSDVPEVSLNGKPGAYCATNRLGRTFVSDGVTYTCKGPKPYRWRR